MYDTAYGALLGCAAVGAGLMAGVYFAFSGFIMKSLDRVGAASATAAMNSINEVIVRSWFMPLFLGTTLLFLALAVMGLLDWDGAHAPLQLTAGIVYVAGMFTCTALFNVPLNNRLAAEGERFWPHYLVYWTRWNHLRALCSLVACALALYLLGVSETP